MVRFDGRSPDTTALRAMVQAMAHRGPDGHGIHVDGKVGLAHRRLAVISPQGGQQPFVDDDEALALVYNGEIYNYVEIRQALKGATGFKTSSDTEVLLKSYAAGGMGCLEQFRGMFAFALYDRRRNALLLARDRMGIKPLYYRHTDSAFHFASELPALVAATGPLEIDPAAVAAYLRWGYLPGPLSIYRGVRMLEPGHFLWLDLATGRLENVRYWSLATRRAAPRGGEALEELNALLEDTFRIYVRSDVPSGAFLSGGVDSTLVSAVMSRHVQAPLNTFSIGFAEDSHSELPYARHVAQAIGSAHHEAVLTPTNTADLLGRIAGHFGEPFADSSALPTWLVSQITSERVTVVLSGDGGDELFGGYRSYETTYLESRPGWRNTVKRALSPFANALCVVPALRGVASKVASPIDKHLASRSVFRPHEVRSLVGAAYDTEWPWEQALHEAGAWPDAVTRYQYLDAKTYMVDDVLTKVDRMSMAHSLEVRVPLLDHKVVEYAFSLPLEDKIAIRDGRLRMKHILKQSAERFVSPEFLDRPKMGFGIPVVRWCQHDLRERILDTFSSTSAPTYDWLSRALVRKTLDEFYGGRTDRVAEVWTLLMFGLWLESTQGRPAVVA